LLNNCIETLTEECFDYGCIDNTCYSGEANGSPYKMCAECPLGSYMAMNGKCLTASECSAITGMNPISDGNDRFCVCDDPTKIPQRAADLSLTCETPLTDNCNAQTASGCFYCKDGRVAKEINVHGDISWSCVVVLPKEHCFSVGITFNESYCDTCEDGYYLNEELECQSCKGYGCDGKCSVNPSWDSVPNAEPVCKFNIQCEECMDGFLPLENYNGCVKADYCSEKEAEVFYNWKDDDYTEGMMGDYCRKY
jgi:hypothetical protein